MSEDVPPAAYIELACTTAYSFLHGASAPKDMVRQAVQLGHCGIGIADRNTVSGVVRAKIAIDELREENLLPEGFGWSRARASSSRTKPATSLPIPRHAMAGGG